MRAADLDPLIRVAAVDDDQMLLDGMEAWADGANGLRLVATTGTTAELLRIWTGPLDVVLLDLVLRDGSDPAANVRSLVAAGHRVLVVSVWHDPAQVSATFAAGSSGYLTKDQDLDALGSALREVAGGGTVFSPTLANALRDPHHQRPRLSPREHEILLAYASGMTLHSAARHLGISAETAKTYLDRVKTKYQRLGRPTYTKLDLADRVREDTLHTRPRPTGQRPAKPHHHR